MGKTPDRGASMRSGTNPPRKRADRNPLSARIAKLEQLVNAGMNETFAAKIVGMTDDEVRDALRIPANTELNDEVLVSALTKRVAKNRSGAEKANERASKLERRVSAIEEYLGSDNAEAALKAGQAGGRKSFIQALRDRKVSDDDIRKVLVIVDNGELELSDADLFGELYTAHTSLRACVEEHETRLTNVEEVVEDLETGGHTPWWGWLLGLVVGLIVWWLVWLMPYGVNGSVRDENDQVVGSFSGGWHSGWFGLAIGLVVMGIIALLTTRSATLQRRRSTTESSSVSSHSSSDSSSTTVRQRIANVRPRNRAQDTTPSDEDDTVASEPEPSSTSS